MPRTARRRIIDESRVGTYHCSSRCVRRSSFRDRVLGGLDPSHRQQWFVQRLKGLARLFTIDVMDFAIVDNEFHTVLRNRPDLARKLSPEEVIRRWLQLSRRSLDLKAVPDLKQIEKELAKRGWLAELRRRLSSISWLMIMLKEPIAREANAEDRVRGHFFAERFDAEKLEDGEQRLATSLQINSLAVRLGLANDVVSSQFTAAYARRNGDGDWLAGELVVEVSRSSTDSPASEGAVASEASGAEEASGVEEMRGASEASGAEEAIRTAEVLGGDVSAAQAGDHSNLVKKPPLFNRLPLEVYMDWLANNLGPAGDDAALTTPALTLPEQLPEAWLRYGLDAANWEEAVRTITRRFRWLTRVASDMRCDCRRFVADSSPPPREPGR